MTNEAFRIDAVEMSRRLRIQTSKELSKMSSEERIRFLNEFAKTDPVLRKMRRYKPPGYRNDSEREAK